MLGGDGKRNYFLAFQSNNEARGTGGFFGSYGLASADDGKVASTSSPRALSWTNRRTKRCRSTSARSTQALYGDDPATWAGANMSPHFPYAAQLWLKMWQDRTGERLDGVITTDPVTLSYLLEATGPVTLKDGREITADNVVEFTESEIYALYPLDDAARDAYLQQVSEAALDAVLSGTADPQRSGRGSRKGGGRTSAAHLLRPQGRASDAWRRSSLGGVIPDDAAPFAGLATINGGGNKLDYYLGRDLDYQVLGCNPRWLASDPHHGELRQLRAVVRPAPLRRRAVRSDLRRPTAPRAAATEIISSLRRCTPRRARCWSTRSGTVSRRR